MVNLSTEKSTLTQIKGKSYMAWSIYRPKNPLLHSSRVNHMWHGQSIDRKIHSVLWCTFWHSLKHSSRVNHMWHGQSIDRKIHSVLWCTFWHSLKHSSRVNHMWHGQSIDRKIHSVLWCTFWHSLKHSSRVKDIKVLFFFLPMFDNKVLIHL